MGRGDGARPRSPRSRGDGRERHEHPVAGERGRHTSGKLDCLPEPLPTFPIPTGWRRSRGAWRAVWEPRGPRRSRAHPDRASSSTRQGCRAELLRSDRDGNRPPPARGDGQLFPVVTSSVLRPTVKRLSPSSLRIPGEPGGLPPPRSGGLPPGRAAPARLPTEPGSRHEGRLPRGGLRAVRARRGLPAGDQGVPGVRLPFLGRTLGALRAPGRGLDLRAQGLPGDGGEGPATPAFRWSRATSRRSPTPRTRGP